MSADTSNRRNHHRLSHHTPYSPPPTMAASLPTIDFEFDKLRDRMAAFTARFDDFIERGRRRTLDEKNTFAKTMAEDKGTLPSSPSNEPH